MFASGSHDGTVRIWTKPPNSPDMAPEEPDDYAYHSPHPTDVDYFSYGEMISRSSSPHPDWGYVVHRPDSPDLEHSERSLRAPKGLSIVSSQSSESSMLKLR